MIREGKLIKGNMSGNYNLAGGKIVAPITGSDMVRSNIKGT